MKKMILPLLVFLVVACLFLIAVKSPKKNFSYAGTLEATEMDLSSRLTGVIKEITVQEGDPVKKGSVLVSLSCEEITASAGIAEKEFQRAEELLRVGSMDRGSYDRIKYKRDDAIIRQDWTTIKAPIDGSVITRFYEPGEMVNPGAKLLKIANLKRLWAYIYVPQTLLSKISTGMKLKGTAPDTDLNEITGTVMKINSEAEFTPKNVQTRQERTRLVYGVKLDFENSREILKPGMTIEMKIPE